MDNSPNNADTYSFNPTELPIDIRITNPKFLGTAYAYDDSVSLQEKIIIVKNIILAKIYSMFARG